MKETINRFIQFISDDPIMLVLCFAIVVLILVFILVLVFYGKKDDKVEKSEVSENTTSLLKPDSTLEPLRSTQEFSLNNLGAEESLESTQKLENIDSLTSENDINVPISINEAMDIKLNRDNEANKDTIEIPIVMDDNPDKVEIPINEDDKSNIKDVQPKTEVNLSNTINQPFSSVYTSLETMPTPMDIPNDTKIIKHNEAEENNIDSQVVSQTSEEENLDDIDLPKLNTNTESSILNTLSGESFDIK